MGLYAVQAADLRSWSGADDGAELLSLVKQIEAKLARQA